MGAIREVSADPAARGRSGDYAPDHARKHLLWLAATIIGVLGLAFVLLVAYGQSPLVADTTELFLLIGLLAFLTCTVAYFADKEREHRAQNRSLITELHQTAQALDARVARLNDLCETSARLTGTLDVERISDLIVEALVTQVRADAASIVLLDKEKGDYLYTHSKGAFAELSGEEASPEAIAKAAAAAGSAEMRLLGCAPEVSRQLEAWGKMRAAITAPMQVSELVGGALAAMREDDFSGEDLNLLTTLANMASKAIESAELHEELRQSYFRTLHVLSRSLAARDPYSAAHGEAVTWLACRLAQWLGMGAKAVEIVQSYGPLHDLGKIGIADAVLLKSGPLSDEELQVCRQHTVIGEEIIRPLNPGPDVLSMIRNHHERWDGAGYPDGLRGEAIPPLARVVAVADAFHAMVSHRPYRPATLAFSAVQEIKALASSQFDPAVVQALADLWENGEVARFNMRPGHAIEPTDSEGRVLTAPPSFTE